MDSHRPLRPLPIDLTTKKPIDPLAQLTEYGPLYRNETGKYKLIDGTVLEVIEITKFTATLCIQSIPSNPTCLFARIPDVTFIEQIRTWLQANGCLQFKENN